MGRDDTKKVRITSLDTELEFTIRAKTTGKALFEQVIQTTGLRETWYFGLLYTDAHGHLAWVNLDKKMKDLDIKNEKILQFKFRFKYFPEDVTQHIIQDQTLRLLYLQVKGDILSEAIFCPAEKAVLLASYATQVKFGDYDEQLVEKGYLVNENILPRPVVSEHKLSREEWEGKVSQFHAKHKGLSKEESMLEYLKLAQDLETYGITYYDVKNKKGGSLLLGVDSLGINIYPKENRVNPQITFPWSEIHRISFNGENFVVKLIEKNSDKFIVHCTLPKMNKRIYDLASGNHELYISRRKPDTLLIQQMRAQKEEQVAVRAKEKADLRREMAARAQLEAQRKELEERYAEMEARMAQREQELEAKSALIAQLEQQLAEVGQAKADMDTQQAELRRMLAELESAQHVGEAERTRMEEEIAAKQEEIETIRGMVDEKEAESRRLQEEVEAARLKMEENEAELRCELEASQAQRAAEAELARVTAEAEQKLKEAAMSNGERTSVSGESSSSAEEMESKAAPQSMPDDLEREVNMREDMKESLKELEQTLSDKRTEDEESTLSRQHRENLRRGQDKYKTLREVRKGNTKRRIDNFENM